MTSIVILYNTPPKPHGPDSLSAKNCDTSVIGSISVSCIRINFLYPSIMARTSVLYRFGLGLVLGLVLWFSAFG